MRGAGGTPGGAGMFFLGLGMLIAGLYLLLNAITISSSFGFGMSIYRGYAFGISYAITSGLVLIPFFIGVGMIFYNSKNVVGWLLAGGALIALIVGVISSIHFSMRSMSAFDLLTILVLTAGGLGLFLRALR